MTTAQDLIARTDRFALAVTNLCAALPKNGPLANILEQLGNAGTSVSANYRSTCRARSPKEFVSRIAVVAEEADESVYWLELLVQTGSAGSSNAQDLLGEARELRAIFARSYSTAKKNLQHRVKTR
jgi:four helix bundle protein